LGGLGISLTYLDPAEIKEGMWEKKKKSLKGKKKNINHPPKKSLR